MTSGPESLRKALDIAIRDAVSGKDVAVAFSGGLDSGIVAAVAKEYADNVILYTVGTDNSHDVKEAETSAEDLGMEWVHISITEGEVLDCLREMISITGTRDPITLSFEIPLFFVCKDCKEKDVITGQGADELFAGYSRYIGLTEDGLRTKITEDRRKLSEYTLPHEKKVAEHFCKTIRYPFLDREVLDTVNDLKIFTAPTDDPMSRKAVLREVSGLMGYPNFSIKEKKAAQYGSGAMTLIKKICKEKNTTYAGLIEILCKGVEHNG